MSPTNIAVVASTEPVERSRNRKPGSGRPGQPRRKPQMSPIPNIRLIESGIVAARHGSGELQWTDHEYEQLCFDLLQERQTGQIRSASQARKAPLPIQTCTTTELRLPDRTANDEPTEYQYDSGLFHRQRTVSAELPEAKRWCGQFTCAYIEVINGKRGIKQIERWLDERTSRQVKSEVAHRTRWQPKNFTIFSLHVSEPTDSVIEGSCVLKSDENYYVMTFRFEGWDRRWMCTHLRIHA